MIVLNATFNHYEFHHILQFYSYSKFNHTDNVTCKDLCLLQSFVNVSILQKTVNSVTVENYSRQYCYSTLNIED